MIFASFLFACSKDENPLPESRMDYTDLQNREVKFNKNQRIDLDKNGTNDFTFGTIHVGDPLLGIDRIQFFAGSGNYSFLIIDNAEESAILNKGDRVSFTPPAGHQWFNIAFTVLTEKIIPENDPAYWQGPWTNITHRYLAVQIERDGKRYNGWIELSVDKNQEKLILHRGAISKEPSIDVSAGQ